ncbi:putative methyltransferase-domain-containing protein [Chaetomidium leptoderma]|uniref:Methyltransferase-domain-containing protein n=1 Tax=Chaetomidium leptoderma TaxID=669021 RepID=A0AAN6ZXR2_9PEZI|nr:putative methyltransferase-domain-containing protein [Chaetomidium leptoderma]
MRDTALLPPTEEELPHLWQKPAFDVLLAGLKKLRVELRVWTLHDSRRDILEEQAATAHDRREIVSFLSTIIKSSLAWLDSDDERELIWEEASKRMSERCGRTAMGEITRCWPFEHCDHGSFSLAIREPPLAGDSLGLKTWGSSYALAQLLHEFAAGPLAHLFVPGAISTPEEVLELGSGTGLLGLAAACIWKTSVVLTDLPTIVPNLAHNASLNMQVVEERGGRAEVAPLTWGGGKDGIDARFRALNRYQLIIVADPLYDDDHPALLTSAVDEQLALNSDARVLVMVPQRDEITKGLLCTLREELAQRPHPLLCLEESIVDGQDDWGDEHDHDEMGNVGFWWGIFGRGQPASA